MKKILLSLACLMTFQVFAQKKILFLGNSYTAVNNLPDLIYRLALADGDTIVFDSSTPGGYTFEQHSTDPVALGKINAQAWDYVVLQEQSQRPSFDPQQVAVEVLPFARKLDSLIHVNNPCTQTVFYMTWGRKYGDASNCAFYPPVCTYAGMQQRLRESYLLMGDENHARVAPVGIAFQNSIAIDSAFELYNADQSHPSLAGSYLAACTFYATMFKRNPVGNTFISGLSANVAAYLQDVAAHTVLDSLATWNIGEYEPNATFSFTTNGTTASFLSENIYSTQHSWSFGGNTFNPTHDFGTGGDFNVTHIACDSCRCDTSTQTVHISSIGIEENVLNQFLKIYPNPSKDRVTLSLQANNFSDKLNIKLMTIQGKLIQEFSLTENTVLDFDTRKLESGIYLLSFTDDSGNTFSKKLILE